MPATYDRGTTKYVIHKTANCRAASTQGKSITCPHCNTSSRTGDVRDGECPFCGKPINRGR